VIKCPINSHNQFFFILKTNKILNFFFKVSYLYHINNSLNHDYYFLYCFLYSSFYFIRIYILCYFLLSIYFYLFCIYNIFFDWLIFYLLKVSNIAILYLKYGIGDRYSTVFKNYFIWCS
jgi:hypothetical protein